MNHKAKKMILQDTNYYAKACMKAWLICEACVYMELSKENPDTQVVHECHDCAETCFALACQLITQQTENIDRLAFLCMLHCRQCAVICDKYQEVDDMHYCGSACITCSIIVRDLIAPINLN